MMARAAMPLEESAYDGGAEDNGEDDAAPYASDKWRRSEDTSLDEDGHATPDPFGTEVEHVAEPVVDLQKLDEALLNDGFWPSTPGNFEMSSEFSEALSDHRFSPTPQGLHASHQPAHASAELLFDLEL
mmetsp:Transcript_3357/g.13409  ORF Transcript_3357/g.13409 Transcript_3357/m.13409 type:complete len:129 (+) Transcript_3357:679-1065(+)